MTLYQGKSIYVSWAKVDPGSSAGVLRYLLEALKPRLSMPLPAAAAIEVNLPGRGDEAPANVLLAPTQV